MPPPAEQLAEESLLLKQVRNHIEFESDLKNQVAKVGSKVKLLCTVVGPKPTLTWFKDDEPFEFEPPKIKNTSSGTFGSITFLAVAEKDAGVYKCVAANQFCEVESECTLTVLPTQDPNWIKPTFTRNLKGLFKFALFRKNLESFLSYTCGNIFEQWEMEQFLENYIFHLFRKLF